MAKMEICNQKQLKICFEKTVTEGAAYSYMSHLRSVAKAIGVSKVCSDTFTSEPEIIEKLETLLKNNVIKKKERDDWRSAVRCYFQCLGNLE